MEATYPSVMYHHTESRRTVGSQGEADALGDGWRDTPYSSMERAQMGLGPRVKPERPKRNDYATPEAFFAAQSDYANAVEEYEHSLVSD